MFNRPSAELSQTEHPPAELRTVDLRLRNARYQIDRLFGRNRLRLAQFSISLKEIIPEARVTAVPDTTLKRTEESSYLSVTRESADPL